MTPRIGILGGMGPLAAVDLMTKIIASTAAECDQDHVPVVTWNVPQVPDRQRALAGDGPSPLPAMLEGIARLNEAGATCIAIACNTAHHWYDALQAQSAAPILHIARVTLDVLQRNGSQASGPVGLIATQGTLDARLYQDLLQLAGIGCILPDQDQMRSLFVPGCYAIKRGELEQGGHLLDALAEALMMAGATRLVLACTEVPVGLECIRSKRLPLCIDPTLALAQACVAHWRG